MTFFAFVIGVVSGCSSSKSSAPTRAKDEIAEGAAPNESPAPKSKTTKVYRSPKALFADMPKDAYPKSGPAAGIERAAAKKWMRDNLVGRVVTWDDTITGVTVNGDGPFNVGFRLAKKFQRVHYQAEQHREADCFRFGDKFTLGREVYSAVLIIDGVSTSEDTSEERRIDDVSGNPIIVRSIGSLSYTCSTEEAKRLRDLDGKSVTLRAEIEGVFDEGRLPGELKVGDFPPPLVVLRLSRPAVNTVSPKTDR